MYFLFDDLKAPSEERIQTWHDTCQVEKPTSCTTWRGKGQLVTPKIVTRTEKSQNWATSFEQNSSLTSELAQFYLASKVRNCGTQHLWFCCLWQFARRKSVNHILAFIVAWYGYLVDVHAPKCGECSSNITIAQMCSQQSLGTTIPLHSPQLLAKR